ncbi:DUF3822 family protein [Maribacter thermophilus]|uniref:DUF3822 family protein n=1 Tax=Maribacter thermophilus TaxID=1197874 RepID=UPI0006410ED2|nr:DUF3822 family protein [Maribacter thermophilus]
MTRKTTNKGLDIADKNFKKLSIQVSLNGLSFCVADTVSNKVTKADSKLFHEEHNPMTLLKALEKLFHEHTLDQGTFDEVVVIHSNTLFGLVPKPLFNKDELANYLKFNTKVLASDVLAYDELENLDIVNVYVPYMNINNYIYDIFGEFTYMHNGTVLIQSLLNNYGNHKEAVCYVHVGKKQMDVTVIKQKKLLLYNSFLYETKEDFVYYLLFVLEQLELDTDAVSVKLFGTIEEDDEVYQLCYSYVQNLSIFAPSSPHHLDLGEPETESIDFTLINAI